jgi:anti-sigma regulatory factor (Ser/Thr protein kinase)
MNLIRELAVDHPEDFERKDPLGFRPVEHFTNDDDYWKVAGSMSDALVEQCKVDDVAKAAIRVCLDEICENVVHHADTPLGGFAAAQGWAKGGTFEVAIVDLGVGIRGSLTKNPDYVHIDDDAEAIATALKPRVTSTPERNAGIGLFITSMVLAFNGGHLLARSGNGVAFRGAKPRNERRTATLPGTVVAIKANADRPLDLTPVYEALDKLTKTS